MSSEPVSTSASIGSNFKVFLLWIAGDDVDLEQAHADEDSMLKRTCASRYSWLPGMRGAGFTSMIGTKLAHYEITATWAQAEWARCIRPPTRSWAAALRSNSCPKRSRTMRTAWRDSSVKPSAGVAESSQHRGDLTASRNPAGRKFLVMELVEGETLAERIEARADPNR